MRLFVLDLNRSCLAQGCVDCTDRYLFPYWSIFIMMGMGCLLLVGILLFFNIGLNPTLDSWLLFSQVKQVNVSLAKLMP